MELKITKYQKTEVGNIPEDWVIEYLYNLCSKLNVGFVGVCEPFFTDEHNGILLIRTGNLQGNKLLLEGSKYITDEFHKRNQKSKVLSGDILIARHGSSGNAVLVPENIKEANTLNIVILRNNSKVYRNFLSNIINSTSVKSQVINLTAGSTQGVINTSAIAKLKIPLPPTLTEQKAIATALSDVDELINNLEKLIKKKKATKQGAMQQLLTPPHKGGKRLEGFSGEWVEKRLGDLCKITTGKLDANAMVPNGEYRFYTCARDYYFIDSFAFDTEALLVSGNGANVGYIHYYKGKFNAYQRTYVLDRFSENIQFIKLLLDVYLSKRIKSEKFEGNTPYIVMDTLSEMLFFIPFEIMEQQAIAQIFIDIESEISDLEKQKSKYQSIKQGMMQELLTGKTRLI